MSRAAGGVWTLDGLAAVFGVWTTIGNPTRGGFRERVAAGAFAKSLARGDDVRALFNHDPNIVLGRTKAGTLELHEDSVGLRSRILLPETGFGRDLLTSVSRGDVSQMSFTFRVVREEWAVGVDGVDERTLLDLDLFDVAPVTFAAYSTTSVTAGRAAAPDPAAGQRRRYLEQLAAADRRRRHLRILEIERGRSAAR